MEEQEQRTLIRNLFDNYPEASGGMALRCLKYDYNNFKFLFVDEETEKTYEVTLPMVMEAFPKFVKYVLDGNNRAERWIFKVFDRADIYNEDIWDAISVDALTQFTIFGEVIYG